MPQSCPNHHQLSLGATSLKKGPKATPNILSNKGLLKLLFGKMLGIEASFTSLCSSTTTVYSNDH